MDKYSFYKYIFIIYLLSFFATTCESGKRKRTTETTSTSAASSSSARVSSGKNLLRECFADFLILQFGGKTKMSGGKGNRKLFVLNPLSVDREDFRVFLQGNEGKTAELWNCFDSVRPFPHKNVDGMKKLASLMEIFRKEITRMAKVAPSGYIQEKLHNAQCLLDAGVIEGKILMKKSSEYSEQQQQYEPAEESEWFRQELKEFGKHPQQNIALSTEGINHLGKCLHKGKPFAAKMEAKRQKLSNEQLLSLLDSVDREKLMKIIIAKQVPFSDWLLNQLGGFRLCIGEICRIENANFPPDTAALNQRQKQCFADLFFSYFDDVGIENSDQQLMVEGNYWPKRQRLSGLIADADTEEAEQFVVCLKGASPFWNHLRNPKHVQHLIDEFYDQLAPKQEIPLSQQMQQKIHNALCWFDLGAIEGKLSMEIIQPYASLGNNIEDDGYRRDDWNDELGSDQPILVSTEGATFLKRCLRKGAPFEAKLEEIAGENQWHLQLLDTSEQSNLKYIIGQTYSSEWLKKEIFYEQNCVADFLIRYWHVQTRADYFYTQSRKTRTFKLWRQIEWSDYVQQGGRSLQVYAKDNAKEFDMLEICIVRKALLLKMDAQLERYIDLEPLFQFMRDSIFTTPTLTKELYIQSSCLAHFLASKSSDKKCLLKKSRGPVGEPLTNQSGHPASPYIINHEPGPGYYALSAENCLLPDEEPGVYSKGSDEFEQLWKCGVRMITMPEQQEGRIETIDVRNLRKIHTPSQLYLLGDPMQIFFSTKMALNKGDECSICLQEYAQDDRTVVSIKRCKHHFHRRCILSWEFTVCYQLSTERIPHS